MSIPSRANDVLAGAATLMAVTTPCVVMRIWVRSRLKTQGVDDYLIIGSWFFLMAYCTLLIVARRVGFGLHQTNVSDEDYEKWLIIDTGMSATYSTGVPLAKMSFAVLYMRILPNRYLRILNQVLIGFLVCQCIEEITFVVFKCKPIEASFKLNIPGKCLDVRVFWWVTFAFNMCTDLCLFIQPIPSLWKLQMALAKRIGVIVMMSLGLLVCGISIIRIVYASQISSDGTWSFVNSILWSGAELAALITCACIPCIRQVLHYIPWLNHAFGLSSNKASTDRYGQSRGKAHGSIPLQNYQQRDYLQCQRPKGNMHYSAASFGMTSKAVAGPHSSNDSQEEIFPYKTDGNGAIVVTHELTRDIESRLSSAAGWGKNGGFKGPEKE